MHTKERLISYLIFTKVQKKIKTPRPGLTALSVIVHRQAFEPESRGRQPLMLTNERLVEILHKLYTTEAISLFNSADLIF